MVIPRGLVLAFGASLAVPSVQFTDHNTRRFKNTNQVLQPDVLEALETCSRIHDSALVDQKTRFRDRPDPSPQYKGSTFLTGKQPHFLFVHVGHSCGGSVTSTLSTEANKMRREIHRGKESPLEQGRAIYDTVHVHPVRKSVLNAATHVLISLRDPVDRFISAYNSNACLYGGESRDTCVRPSNPTTKLIMPKAREEEAAGAAAEEMLDLQDAHSSLGCFPNITAFADHLDDDSDCGRAARDVIHPPWAVHVKMGACYYLGGLVETLLRKSVHIVHAESCDKDIRRIPKWLGLNLTFDEPREAHRDAFPHHDDQPNQAGRRRLRLHLTHEYALQDALEHMASTWNPAADGGFFSPLTHEAKTFFPAVGIQNDFKADQERKAALRETCIGTLDPDTEECVHGTTDQLEFARPSQSLSGREATALVE